MTEQTAPSSAPSLRAIAVQSRKMQCIRIVQTGIHAGACGAARQTRPECLLHRKCRHRWAHHAILRPCAAVDSGMLIRSMQHWHVLQRSLGSKDAFKHFSKCYGCCRQKFPPEAPHQLPEGQAWRNRLCDSSYRHRGHPHRRQVQRCETDSGPSMQRGLVYQALRRASLHNTMRTCQATQLQQADSVSSMPFIHAAMPQLHLPSLQEEQGS